MQDFFLFFFIDIMEPVKNEMHFIGLDFYSLIKTAKTENRFIFWGKNKMAWYICRKRWTILHLRLKEEVIPLSS